MESIFTKISKILAPDVRIELYSPLNQHLINSNKVILWNEDIQTIDDDTYEKFRVAIKKGKTCTFYTLNKTLPFQDFCIALLCSVDYSLNHNTVPVVLQKSYMFAWRALVILADISDESVKVWLKKRLNGRSNHGYNNLLGVNTQNVINSNRRFSEGAAMTKFALDEDKISRACISKKLKDVIEDTPVTLSPIVSRVTATPEGQLVSLRIVHETLLNKGF